MAIRDQIISEQRNVIKNLWNVMEYSGLDKDAILEIAQNEGALSFLAGRVELKCVRDSNGSVLGDSKQSAFCRGFRIADFDKHGSIGTEKFPLQKSRATRKTRCAFSIAKCSIHV